MRDALPTLEVPEHLQLAYDAWAPVGDEGKVPDERRADWLARIANLAMPADYVIAFERWKSSFRRPGERVRPVELASRLLVGHGNSSATGVGLTVHHTWGVPVIPGSALKGLLAHHIDAHYGPDNPALAPWEQPEPEERERARYQGPLWDDTEKRIRRGPGEIYRALFGAPEAKEDGSMDEHLLPAGETAGLVHFHDALYVPGSAEADQPFAVDVLTVHQKPYYDSEGDRWANDYSRPNPVGFLTVRRKTRFLLALSGRADWTALAETLLVEALQDWGAGGKTSSGYGRIAGNPEGAPEKAPAERTPSKPRHQRGDRILVTRVEDPKGKKAKFQADDGFIGHFAESPPNIAIGETVEVWVANKNEQGYTLSHQEIKAKSGKGKK